MLGAEVQANSVVGLVPTLNPIDANHMSVLARFIRRPLEVSLQQWRGTMARMIDFYL